MKCCVAAAAALCKRWQGDKRQRRIYSSAFWAKLPSRRASVPEAFVLFFVKIVFGSNFVQDFLNFQDCEFLMALLRLFFFNISITFKTTPDANQSLGNPFWCLVDLVPIKNERHEVKESMSKNKLTNLSITFPALSKRQYEQEQINRQVVND